MLEESEYRRENNTVKLVVGNKSDLAEQRSVTYSEGKEWADKRGFPFMEVSSFSSSAVDTVFITLVHKILQQPHLWDKKAWERRRIAKLQEECRKMGRRSECCS